MKKLIIVATIVAMCTACGGGSSVNKAISQVEKAIEKVEKNKGNMSEDDWNTLEKEMEEPLQVIADAFESGKVSAMEKIKIMTLITQWMEVITEAGISQIEKETGVSRENFEEDFKVNLEELEKALQEDL